MRKDNVNQCVRMHFKPNNIFLHFHHTLCAHFFPMKEEEEEDEEEGEEAVLAWAEVMFIVIPFEGACYPPELLLAGVAIRVRVNG